jgi:hypothetical protein
LEGVESPHSTACLLNIVDSILHATILPVRIFWKCWDLKAVAFNYIEPKYMSLALGMNALYVQNRYDCVHMARS